MSKKEMNPIVVVLNLPPQCAAFIIRASQIHDSMAANVATLPAPTPPLSVLAAHIATLVTKEAAVKMRTLGAVAERDDARKAVAEDLTAERAYVASLVVANPGDAESLVADASMFLRKPNTVNKPPLATKPGRTRGVLAIIARAAPGARANEWQVSVDGGKSWQDLPPTTGARTTVASLAPGVTVLVRHRVLTKAGLSDWGEPVSAMVQ